MNDDLYLMVPKHSEDGDDPDPPTDTNFPQANIVRRNLLAPARFALGLGLAWGILFIVMALIAGNAITELAVFKALYPGYAENAFLAGFVWNVIYGWISGLFIAIFYNALVRQFVYAGGDGFERYG